MLGSYSIDRVFIKIYENQIFSFDFTPMHVYMFGLSFLTTLNIYKDYFKGRHIVTGDNLPSSSFSSRSCCICSSQSFVTKEFRDLHRSDELKNFAINILLRLVVSHILGSVQLIGQSRTGSYALKMRDCHYRTSLIRYWGKSSTVDLYKVLGFLYL